MSTKRKTYSADFKAKVVLEVLEGELTLNQIASKYELLPANVKNWKKMFLENMSLAFDKSSVVKEYKNEIEELKIRYKSKQEGFGHFKKYLKELIWEELGEAREGDLIIAQRLLGHRGTPSAKIAEIVGREQSYSIAYIILKDGHRSIVDLKTEFPIGAELTQEELDGYDIGDVFKIDNQENVVLEKLGNMSDPKVDEKIVLAQFNKHDEFDEEVLKFATSFGDVKAKNYPNRKDLRCLTFCTIDPVTAKDYDDAIYYDEKNTTLYVAIADVSEYVKPFGSIDNEAIYRSFSIYLPHRSIPMLPRQLSETLCSLQPHVDRLAFVFEIKLDLDTLEVASSKVYEAIIHSHRRFNYEEIDEYFTQQMLQVKTTLNHIFWQMQS